MQHLRLAVLFCLSFQVSQCQVKGKEIDFKNTCNQIVISFSKKNIAEVNKYISSKYGIYTLFRPGAEDTYKNDKKLDPSDPLFIYPEVRQATIRKYPLQYGILPSFQCEAGKWNKKGFYADSTRKYHPLTTIQNFRMKYDSEKYTQPQLQTIRLLENNSRKIIFTDSSGDGIIFYLTWLSGKWYLTIIDRVTTDCSA